MFSPTRLSSTNVEVDVKLCCSSLMIAGGPGINALSCTALRTDVTAAHPRDSIPKASMSSARFNFSAALCALGPDNSSRARATRGSSFACSNNARSTSSLETVMRACSLSALLMKIS